MAPQLSALYERKRQGLKRLVERPCGDCRMPVLASEDDRLCPWCQDKRDKEADDGTVCA